MDNGGTRWSRRVAASHPTKVYRRPPSSVLRGPVPRRGKSSARKGRNSYQGNPKGRFCVFAALWPMACEGKHTITLRYRRSSASMCFSRQKSLGSADTIDPLTRSCVHPFACVPLSSHILRPTGRPALSICKTLSISIRNMFAWVYTTANPYPSGQWHSRASQPTPTVCLIYLPPSCRAVPLAMHFLLSLSLLLLSTCAHAARWTVAPVAFVTFIRVAHNSPAFLILLPRHMHTLCASLPSPITDHTSGCMRCGSYMPSNHEGSE